VASKPQALGHYYATLQNMNKVGPKRRRLKHQNNARKLVAKYRRPKRNDQDTESEHLRVDAKSLVPRGEILKAGRMEC
jgi:hypothetical protein